MSTKGTSYNVAINGKGYTLAQIPENQQRPMGEAAIYGDTPASIDSEYNDASGYFPWAQTDWSGGFQEEKWRDEATFKYGESVDPLTEYGTLRLNNLYTSVLTLSAGHSFGASALWNRKLYIGTQTTAGVAKLHTLNESDTAAEITTGWSAIEKVNSAVNCQDSLVLGLTRTSGSEHTIQTYNGTAFTGIRNTHTEVSMVAAAGQTLYASELVSAADGYNLIYSDDLTTFSERITSFGKNKKPIKGIDYNGTLYFLIEDYPSTELWIDDGTSAERIYRWENLINADINLAFTKMIISGTQSGKTYAYTWDGTQIVPSFVDRIGIPYAGPRYITEYNGNIWTQGLCYDGQYWFPGFMFSFGGGYLTPFQAYGLTDTNLYFYGVDTGITSIMRTNKNSYMPVGFVTTGLFYGNKPGLEKLAHSVDVTFEPLRPGESVAVYYSIDREATWTKVGEATLDGLDSYTFYFPQNLVFHFIQLKIVLYGNTTTTPIMNDFMLRFAVLPNARMQWRLDLECTDKIMLADRYTMEPSLGETLRNNLRAIRFTNRVVDFEDVDYFETQLNGALGRTDTVVTVDVVPAEAPEQGRIRVGDEEIFYTGKTKTQFQGCTRGRRGTIAAAHNDNTVVSNGYKVRILKYEEHMNTNNEDNNREYIATVNIAEQ